MICNLERLRCGTHPGLCERDVLLGDAAGHESLERRLDVLLEVGAHGEASCHCEDRLAKRATVEELADGLDALAPVAIGLHDLHGTSYALRHTLS